MSHIFDALQRVESERAELESHPQPESFGLLRRAERRVASNRETVLMEQGDEGSQPSVAQEQFLRATGTHAPVNGWGPAGLPAPQNNRPVAQDTQASTYAPAPALASPAAGAPIEPSSKLQRGLAGFRAALTFVQAVLPLIDPKIGSSVSSLLAPRPSAPPPPPPPPAVDLSPIEDCLAELEVQSRELRLQVVEQNGSLGRIEDQLEMVKEATNRNTLEQQEFIEELKGVGKKVNFVAWVALGLLAASVAINSALYLHMLKIIQ